MKAILSNWCDGLQDVDIKKLILPLYIRHDYRIYLDHLLSEDKQVEIKERIVKVLNVNDFTQQEALYNEEILRLNKLFQYLVLLSK